MKRLNAVLKRIFCLPGFPTALIFVLSMAFVVAALTTPTPPVVAYMAYFSSAYGVTLFVTYIVRVVRMCEGDIKRFPPVKWFFSIPLGKRLSEDALFRARADMVIGLVFHTAYMAFNLVLGIVYETAWFSILGFYYLFLALMHMALIRHVGETGDLLAGYRRYRLCGILLLMMVSVLITIVIFMVRFDRGYEYPGVLIYVMAMYTFWTVISSGIRWFRHRHRNDPIFAADRSVDFCAAVVSLLALESAMLLQFGKPRDDAFRKTMIILTGCGICVLVGVMAIYMIVRGTRRLRAKQEKT